MFDLNLRQEELAKILNVDLSTIARIER